MVIGSFIEVLSNPQYRMAPRKLKFYQPLALRYKKRFSSSIPWKIRIHRQTTRKLLWQGTKTEKCRDNSQLELFLSFEIDIHYFLYIQGIFKSHLKKITPPKKANSHPKSQFDLSFYYVNLLANLYF